MRGTQTLPEKQVQGQHRAPGACAPVRTPSAWQGTHSTGLDVSTGAPERGTADRGRGEVWGDQQSRCPGTRSPEHGHQSGSGDVPRGQGPAPPRCRESPPGVKPVPQGRLGPPGVDGALQAPGPAPSIHGLRTGGRRERPLHIPRTGWVCEAKLLGQGQGRGPWRGGFGGT